MSKFLDNNGLSYFWGKVTGRLDDKQDTLVSGTNVKTVNGESILGQGNLEVTGDCIAYPTFTIDSNGHLLMSGGQQGLFTLENGHLMYNF